MFTSLYLMKVLPASTPSADLKIIVIVGPSLMMRCIAIPMATTAARMGMAQMIEIRLCLLGTTVACGRLSRSVVSAMAGFPPIVLSQSGTVTLISFTTKIPARQSRNQSSMHHRDAEFAEIGIFFDHNSCPRRLSGEYSESFVLFVSFVVKTS